ncbi:autotransporter outer membrane beta-barrel domain-containing protein, partial [uncultured Helicobacter sp.]|uniref:autotransporter outer membrane beta-barrel domain-containing protein n=1 Tax=uncultured Helicobacter sp. TaxID=175537 RepID=UPI00261FAE55
DNIKYTSGGTEVASNIAVATVVNKSGTNGAQSGQASTNGVVNFALQNTLQGFDEIVSTLVGVYTDEYGKTSSNGNTNTYTTYFVNNARSAGASEANREATATAFGVNYDLYMANFNSLNKRMGELRDNPHSQGAWIRIFNGSQTNDMGLGTKSNYTTFQGGYDYAFGMEGANNYLGLAIAYELSDSKIQSSMADLNGSQRGVENIKSNAVEVAVYNSYVQDEGWYNDTIAKFSYIFSDFNMMGQSQTYSTSNMAFTLSDEFGYRFKLGENKEWTIDPQLEVAYGYFDQSDFVQKLGVATLDSTLESITTLRTRVGSSFGYNFKNFTANKPIKASVYLGTFYEFDYISGGDITMTTNLGSTNSINSLSPDGRVVMNVGTNVEIYDNTRIYFDFESSFAGKIRTDYQVNIGARYSFGESNGYTPAVAKAKEVAPLKVEEVKNTQENQAQESKTNQESK